MKQKQAEIKKQLAHLKNVEGTGTQLVSLYIPGSSNINDYKQRIRQEISEAENIKSKTTMKKVKSALRSISSCLSNYKETPSNGIVVFASSEDTFLSKFEGKTPSSRRERSERVGRGYARRNQTTTKYKSHSNI